jgi:hypothetical protein
MTSLQNLYTRLSQFVNAHNKSRKTHFSDLLEVARQVYPQNLDRDIPAIILTFPHICKSTIAQWKPLWFTVYLNFQRSRDQGLAATGPV